MGLYRGDVVIGPGVIERLGTGRFRYSSGRRRTTWSLAAIYPSPNPFPKEGGPSVSGGRDLALAPGVVERLGRRVALGRARDMVTRLGVAVSPSSSPVRGRTLVALVDLVTVVRLSVADV